MVLTLRSYLCPNQSATWNMFERKANLTFGIFCHIMMQGGMKALKRIVRFAVFSHDPSCSGISFAQSLFNTDGEKVPVSTPLILKKKSAMVSV